MGIEDKARINYYSAVYIDRSSCIFPQPVSRGTQYIEWSIHSRPQMSLVVYSSSERGAALSMQSTAAFQYHINPEGNR